MSQVNVPIGFWASFVKDYWDKQAGQFCRPFSPAFTSEEIFDAAVQHSDACRKGAADRLSLRVNDRWLTGPEAHEFLPQAEDGNFRVYGERVASAADQTVMLSLHCLERSNGDLWLKSRDFFSGLARQIGGIPHRLTIGSFASNALATPFGVHTDMTSNVTLILDGQKKVRVWPRKSLEQHFPGLGRRARPKLFDYSEYIEDSLLLEGGPGDVLFWPDSYWHIAESDGAFSATLVLGIDMRPNLEAFIAPPIPRQMLESELAAPCGYPARTTPPEESFLLCRPNLHQQLREKWARHMSSLGFHHPVPLRAPHNNSQIKWVTGHSNYPVRYLQTESEILLFANGHRFAIPQNEQALLALNKLNLGSPVDVEDLLGCESSDTESVRSMIEALLLFRAIDPHPKP